MLTVLLFVSADDINLQKLSEFADFVEPNLSHQAKCVSKNLQKIHLITDYLEKMFGKLREGSGGTYFITVQQVSENVSIYKAKLLLQLRVDITDVIDCVYACTKCGYLPNEDICEMLSKLPELEKILASDIIMAILCGRLCCSKAN